jgi:hypothetical protein
MVGRARPHFLEKMMFLPSLINYYLAESAMDKPTIRDDLNKSEKKGAVEVAAAAGMEPAELFAAVVQDYYGIAERRGLVVHWGRKMGIPPSEALLTAMRANLIPTTRRLPGEARKKPPHKGVAKTSE